MQYRIIRQKYIGGFRLIVKNKYGGANCESKVT
jgi:hypothetical protein